MVRKGTAAGPSGLLVEAIRLYNSESTVAKIGNDILYGKETATSRKVLILLNYKMSTFFRNNFVYVIYRVQINY